MDELSLVAPKVGDVWGDGVIFAVGEVTGYDEARGSFVTNVDGINAYRGREVSSRSLGKLAWCKVGAKGEKVSVGAGDKNSGRKNMIALENFIELNDDKLENYPAFVACRDFEEGWYFPAYNEIRCIVANKDMLNAKISEQGGVEISTEVHGCSTEVLRDNKYTDNAGYKYEKGDFNGTKISATSEIRAVRAY